MIRVGFVFSVVPLSVLQLLEHAKPAEQKFSTLFGRLLRLSRCKAAGIAIPAAIVKDQEATCGCSSRGNNGRRALLNSSFFKSDGEAPGVSRMKMAFAKGS